MSRSKSLKPKRQWFAKWQAKCTQETSPLSPYRVLWDLQQTVDVANTIITHDAGSPRDQLVPFWKSTSPHGYIGWGKSTQLGYGLGLAMGAKLVHPDKLCINVWGDAAIGFTGTDLETAARENIPILSILLNNAGDGDRAADHARGDRQVPRDRHHRRLRGVRPFARLPRRKGREGGGHRSRAAPRDRRDRGRSAGAGRVHHRAGNAVPARLRRPCNRLLTTLRHIRRTWVWGRVSMDDLLAEFVAETREMLDALAGEIVAWEADPADRARLDTIFRFVHTVKGNCGFFDFPRLEALSHAAEDALADVRAGKRSADSRLVDAVLAVIDRIGVMIHEIERGETLSDANDEALIAALAGGPQDETGAAATPSAGAAFSATPLAEQRTIRLPVELIDQVMSGVSEMVLARNDLARRMLAMGGDTGLEAPFSRLSALLAEVRDAITRTRMRRIEGLFGTFPRLVRDLSAELGKQVFVELENGEVELDREMIELIRDPMLHVIRNAVDHGIEARRTAVRRASARPGC